MIISQKNLLFQILTPESPRNVGGFSIILSVALRFSSGIFDKNFKIDRKLRMPIF